MLDSALRKTPAPAADEAATDDAPEENPVLYWQKKPEIRALAWQDLVPLSRRETIIELTLSLPWLAAELAFIAYGLYLPALLCSFMFFLTGLRQVHGGYHLSIGLSKKATDLFLFAMSAAMLGAMHAVKFNHLRHHKYCMEEGDIEARSARMNGLRAILFGPLFPVLLHRHALKEGNDYYRRWIYGELAANAAIVLLGLGLWAAGITHILLVHCALMATGQCLTAFFAVWTVHHDCEGKIFARTQRGWLKNFISYDMFYHVEHHLFPKVPQRNLPELSRRLDAAAPELTGKRVY